MRDRLPLLAFALAVLLGGLAVFFARTGNRGDFAGELSTYKSGVDGARALFLLSQQVGLEVERRHLDLTLVEGKPELVLLAVEGEKPKLVDHPDAGGRTLADALTEPGLSEKERKEVLRAVDDGASLLYVVGAHSALLKDLGVTFTPQPDTVSRALVPFSPTPMTRGVHHLQSRVDGYLSHPSGLPILVDPHSMDAPVAMLLQQGRGQVLVVSSTALATNLELGQDDNAAFWLGALRTLQRPAEHIYFDEHHHGFTGERTVSGWAKRYGLHWALLQGLFVLWLGLVAARRVGPPRPLLDTQKHGSVEYLQAMARIYRLGAHRGHAAQALVRGAVRSVEGLTKLPRTSSLEAHAEALVAQGRGELADALRDLRQTSQNEKLTEPELLALARKAAQVRAQAARQQGAITTERKST